MPHGSFREAAFLDGREVKSLNRNESLLEAANGNNARGSNDIDNGLAVVSKNRGDIYDLEIEQRQPLEIRTTDIDIDRLRGSTVTGSNNSGVATDFLLPYSGLIYATREDALRDRSYYKTVVDATTCPTTSTTVGNPCPTDDTSNLSSTDFLLDPTRKPSSIRLINGYRLWRTSNAAALVAGIPQINLDNVDGRLPISSTNYANSPLSQLRAKKA